MNHTELEEFAEARRLWPDPLDAPEVPPEGVLRSFLKDPDAVEQDLADQIRESLNCRRALEKIEIEDGNHPWSDFITAGEKTPFPDLSRLVIPKGRQVPQPVKLPGTGEVAPCFGQVWHTSPNVKIFRDGKIIDRKTFLPPVVIIVEDGVNVGYDTIFRAIPVSPVELWPNSWLGDDELLVKIPGLGEYAAHIWLEYPLSIEQLQGYRSILDKTEQVKLHKSLVLFREQGFVARELGGGRILEPATDDRIILERDRLQERASYLCATADANRKYRAWTIETKLIAILTLPRLKMAAASDRELPVEYWHRVPKYEVDVRITLNEEVNIAEVEILDYTGNPSKTLDGSEIVLAGNKSVPIREGRATVRMEDLQDINKSEAIRASNGDFIQLESRPDDA